MKYLLYTVAILVILYLSSVFICHLLNRRHTIELDRRPLSRDCMAAIKGFAILIIMVGHIGNGFGIRYLTPLGSWGVALFLICSGYGLEKSLLKNGLKSYWKKRILTAYVPYLVFEIFGYCFLYGAIDLPAIIKDLLLIEPLHPFGWYMQCLFLYYIAFWISALAEKKSVVLKYCILTASAVLMFVFLRSLFKQQLFSFILGVLMAKFDGFSQKYIRKLGIGIPLLSLGALALAAKQVGFIRNGPSVIFYSAEAVQCSALAIGTISVIACLICVIPRCFYKPVALLGVISFELYLIHGFFISESVGIFEITSFFVLSLSVSGVVYLVRDYLKLLFSRIKNVKQN